MGLSLKTAVATALLTLAASANAEYTVVRSTGLLSGDDGIGLFSARNTTLVNVPYALTVSFGTDTIDARNYYQDDTYHSRGTSYISPVFAVLTANGKTIKRELYGDVLESIADGIGGRDSVDLYFGVGGQNMSMWLGLTVASVGWDWLSLDEKVKSSTYMVNSTALYSGGMLNFYDGRWYTDERAFSYFDSKITSISINEVSGTIPEPSNLFLAGIALTSIAVARRRKKKKEL